MRQHNSRLRFFSSLFSFVYWDLHFDHFHLINFYLNIHARMRERNNSSGRLLSWRRRSQQFGYFVRCVQPKSRRNWISAAFPPLSLSLSFIPKNRKFKTLSSIFEHSPSLVCTLHQLQFIVFKYESLSLVSSKKCTRIKIKMISEERRAWWNGKRELRFHREFKFSTWYERRGRSKTLHAEHA